MEGLLMMNANTIVFHISDEWPWQMYAVWSSQESESSNAPNWQEVGSNMLLLMDQQTQLQLVKKTWQAPASATKASWGRSAKLRRSARIQWLGMDGLSDVDDDENVLPTWRCFNMWKKEEAVDLGDTYFQAKPYVWFNGAQGSQSTYR